MILNGGKKLIKIISFQISASAAAGANTKAIRPPKKNIPDANGDSDLFIKST